MSAYVPSVSIRKLFAMLVAVAVMFVPAVTGMSAALAAVPDHHMQMMSTGHCKAMAAACQSFAPLPAGFPSGCCPRPPRDSATASLPRPPR